MASGQQGVLAVILVAMLAAFVSGRLRFDIVAVAGLLTAVAFGLVSAEAAFSGFGSSAVITVAAVLVLTRVLSDSGVFERWAARLPVGAGLGAQLAALGGAAALTSAFMNNIGALALFMPAAIGLARRSGRPAALYLLPLSYATLLGGMATLIGTPANLLVADFRARAVGEAFALFDFAFVGAPLALLGVACLALIGGNRRQEDNDADAPPTPDDGPFSPGDYDTELMVAAGSPLIGRPAAAVGEHGRARVYGVVRDDRRVFGRLAEEPLQPGDILLLRADSAALRVLTETAGLRAALAPPPSGDETLTEVVVAPNALIQGSCAAALDLPDRFGVVLAAAARQGRRAEGRLADLNLSAGDVLLLRGDPATAQAAAAELGCLPLADRGLSLQPRNAALALAVFAAAVTAAAFNLASPAVAFVAGVLALHLVGALRAGEIYRLADWPVIVLLAAMIPLGEALQSTGLAARLGEAALFLVGGGGPVVMTALILAATMLLTPVLNNPATVVVMAPIALEVALRLGVSPDPLLMAVAVGASADFLTPFGHHNNALVMGPGGYRFGDYARLGWRLELLVFIVGTTLIAAVWL